jgi:ribosome biogenesis SPOUT family RNA methylase Rps3
MGALGAVEHGQHILTLGGILGDYPPTDPAGFDAFADKPVPCQTRHMTW